MVKAHTRKPKRTIDELTEGLPVEKILLDLSEEEQICGACGSKLKRIGEKFVRREIEVTQRQVRALEYYTSTYACPECEKETGYAHIYEHKAPPRLLKHSLASASSVADIMTRKYVDRLPLARQEKIWAREGLALSRGTMANWVIKTARTWLKPLCRALKKYLLELGVIYADETVVQVLKEDGKSAASESRIWVYASNDRSGRPVRYFEYQPDRSGKHAAAFLKGFTGCLVTDGYAGYNQVEGVVRCGCWAHMRRKWRQAMPKGATKETSKAAIGYDYCNKLFALERKYAGLDDAVRKTARQVGAEPLLEAYWWWVETLEAAPGSKLAEAVTYARNQKAYLNAFLDHGEVDISNNFAENNLLAFCERWRGQYLSCVKSWEENWEVLSTFFEYPLEIRKIVYTTNIIEGLNRQFRQITKSKPSFTNDDSPQRMLYLASQRIIKHWHARCQNWDLVLSQLELMFPQRAVS